MLRSIPISKSPISTAVAQHTPGVSIALHLIPGLLTGAVYYLLAPLAARLGLPSITGILIAVILVTIPFEMAVILLEARKLGQPIRSFIKVIAYTEPIPLWRYLVMVPVIFVACGVLFTLLSPVTSFFQSQFAWLPDTMVLNLGQVGGFSKSTLIVITALNALLVGILGPVVEELYFRGFLLPRMPQGLDCWTPLIHSFLFAVYHLWSPWMIVTRTIGVLPLIYIVMRNRNIYLGMIAHCLINLVDVITMVVFITQMS